MSGEKRRRRGAIDCETPEDYMKVINSKKKYSYR